VQQRFGSRPKAWRWAFMLLLYLAILLPRVMAGDHTLRGDEPYFFEWASRFYTSLINLDPRGTLIGFGHPSTTIYWLDSFVIFFEQSFQTLAHGMPFTQDTLTAVPLSLTLQTLLLRRFPVILIDTALTILSFRLLARLIDWRIALLGILFISLEPVALSEARVLRSESLAAASMLAAFLSYLVFVSGKGGRRYLWLAGILVGVAIATRVSSVFVLGMMMLVGMTSLLLDRHGSPWQGRLAALIASGLVLLVSSAAIFVLLWPVSWVNPIAAFKLSIGIVTKLVNDPRLTFFLGALRERDPIMVLYYPILLLLKTSPLLLIGVVVFVPTSVRRTLRWWRTVARRQPTVWRALAVMDPQAWTGNALFIYALLFVAQMSTGGHKYDHYIMPAFPALDLAAAIGLWWAIGWIVSLVGKSSESVRNLTAAGLFVVQAVIVLQFHPHYTAYASPLFGGPATTSNVIELQAGEEEAAHFLDSLPDAARAIAAVRTTRRFEPIFHGQTLQLTNNPTWAQADYIVISSYHLQREIHDRQLLTYLQRQTPLQVVRIGGKDYVWVYSGPQDGCYVNSSLTAKATLLRFGIEGEETDPSNWQAVSGDAVRLHFLWQNDGMTQGEVLRLRLVDAGGSPWAEAVIEPRADYAADAGKIDGIITGSVKVALPVGMPPGEYYFKVQLYDEAQGIVLGTFDLPHECDMVEVVKPTSWPPAAQVQVEHRVDAVVTDNLRLVGYDLPGNELQAEHTTTLTLIWQAVAEPPDYAIAIQLRDEQDEEAAYWLGRPGRSSYPTNRWQAGEIVRDQWDLDVPPDVPTGEYRLNLVLFAAASGEMVGEMDLGYISLDK
jgi:4-amino-4-deoxy-L-arabinose transferase-like glycosyltransferase